MKTNMKTTVLGIATILTAVSSAAIALFDGDPATSFDIGSVIAAITAGIGLIMAKDAEKKA
ncbi:hypothetical protein UFOVP401_17 [uncultured Caudovirales phage]|uniref:Uncharacterized protein n=1 Tax=uncultured Caudovirales phage TaxID=2100421 RepID=A0A6J5M605_9CAUD|nr:hypothetical protein UFOVP401_17 [uncultured Caudovirales phage]